MAELPPDSGMRVLPAAVTTDPEITTATVAVLPVGSFEQHGPHLPMATDTLVAVAISHNITGALRRLPPVTVACSHEHAAFPGTVSISATTLTAIINDIAASLDQQGITRMLVINGHGGNYVLSNVVQQANAARPRSMALFPTRADWDQARHAAGMTGDTHQDMHAGELETSILLAAFPDYLREGWEHDDHSPPDRRDLLTLGISAYTSTGVIGSPSLASPSKGQAALRSLGENAGKKIGVLTETSPSQ